MEREYLFTFRTRRSANADVARDIRADVTAGEIPAHQRRVAFGRGTVTGAAGKGELYAPPPPVYLPPLSMYEVSFGCQLAQFSRADSAVQPAPL